MTLYFFVYKLNELIISNILNNILLSCYDSFWICYYFIGYVAFMCTALVCGNEFFCK